MAMFYSPVVQRSIVLSIYQEENDKTDNFLVNY